tara:strand:- start:400 stop:543 length:144 start_codon:yes stop_codon:yes gene_type:complete
METGSGLHGAAASSSISTAEIAEVAPPGRDLGGEAWIVKGERRGKSK